MSEAAVFPRSPGYSRRCSGPSTLAPSSPLQGAEFTSRVLEALTSNPEVWGRTVLFLTFDENDGLFDHVPAPAPPSYNLDGTLAGKSTLDLRGQYFSDPERRYLDPADNISGSVRPWGLGPRVPLYVISPWSRGGWVNSQVFDHTSIGQFLEKRLTRFSSRALREHNAARRDSGEEARRYHAPLRS
jgi:phospholipase C